jgi:hypothetical protein
MHPIDSMSLSFSYKTDLKRNPRKRAAEVEAEWPRNIRSCYARFLPSTILEETDTEYLLLQQVWFNPASQPRTEEEWEYVGCLSECVARRLYELNSKGTQTNSIGEEEDERSCFDFDEVDVTPCDKRDQRHVNTGMFRLE